MRVLAVAGFVLVCGWAGCRSAPTQPLRDRLTVLTYNVLADKYRDEDRLPALFAIFAASDADFLCLQEVVPAFLYLLRKEPWFRGRYHLPRLHGRHALANGNVICSRFPIERVEVVDHRSPQGRQSMIVHVRVDGEPVAVATCHLESPLNDGPERARQLDQVFERLANVDTAVFAGDFNFGDGEQPDTQHLPSSYADLWLQLKPGEPGYTWNIETSDMAARGSFVGESSRRLDRILVRSASWSPAQARIVGAELLDVEGLIHPSDHFGVVGVLARQQ